MNRLRTIAGMTLVVILAACGPAASGGSDVPDDSEAPPSQAQGSGDGPEPSFSAGLVADLEALIPRTIGDLTMDVTSMRGNEFLVSDDSDPATVKFLQDLGVEPSDVSMAVGFGFSADFESSLVMFVFKAEGANPDNLVNAFKESTDTDRDEPLEWSSANVGGKQVETAVDGESTIYLYSRGDTLIFIGASDPAMGEEVLSGLP